MKGKFVPRKAGWDTHGLPVELEVEKLLGLNGKEQIEEYGCPHMRKNFVYFSKNIPRGSFTIKKCFDRIKAQFIHAQSSNAKTVSRYLGEEVA